MTASVPHLPCLTSVPPGAGCAGKLPLGKLGELLGSLGDMEPAFGDFFTPIVDDPRDWGNTAAVNDVGRIAEGGAGQIRVHAA